VIEKLGGVSRSLVIGCLGNTMFIAASVLPTLRKQDPESDSIFLSEGFIYSTMIVSGVICGFGQALLWTSQGYYISQCAEPVQQNKGLYFSLFWSTYMLSQIFGNLAAAFIIGQLSQVTYFYIMTGVSLASSVVFATLRKPLKHCTFEITDQNLENPSASVYLGL
jgi:MFS family permease